MKLPDTIDDVIALTDHVIAWSVEHESRHGYFAAAYKHVTITIKALLAHDGYFETPARIEALDVAFARRYMSAVFEDMGQPIGGPGVTPPWSASFATLDDDDLCIMQHLMTGVAVHVNYDLGIATAELNPGEQLHTIEHDFKQLNAVFSVLGTVLLKDLAPVSPAIDLFSRIPDVAERPMFFLTSVFMRELAWSLAKKLAPTPPVSWPPIIDERADLTVTAVKEIADPPFIEGILEEVADAEEPDVAKVIKAINTRADVSFDHMVLPT